MLNTYRVAIPAKVDMKIIAPTILSFYACNSIKLLRRSLQNWTTQYFEPKIQSKQDFRGNSYFEVYDPVSRKSFTCGSEQEVRIWLEKRYYH